MLTLKKSDPSADTASLEFDIARMVYTLYGVTKEEMKLLRDLWFYYIYLGITLFDATIMKIVQDRTNL